MKLGEKKANHKDVQKFQNYINKTERKTNILQKKELIFFPFASCSLQNTFFCIYNIIDQWNLIMNFPVNSGKFQNHLKKLMY